MFRQKERKKPDDSRHRIRLLIPSAASLPQQDRSRHRVDRRLRHDPAIPAGSRPGAANSEADQQKPASRHAAGRPAPPGGGRSDRSPPARRPERSSSRSRHYFRPRAGNVLTAFLPVVQNHTLHRDKLGGGGAVPSPRMPKSPKMRKKVISSFSLAGACRGGYITNVRPKKVIFLTGFRWTYPLEIELPEKDRK